MKKILFLLILVLGCTEVQETEKPLDDFCGSSTEFTCSIDNDCIIGGCSGQVCQGKLEGPLMTTCEYKDCYDSKSYSKNCGCIEGKCMWD